MDQRRDAFGINHARLVSTRKIHLYPKAHADIPLTPYRVLLVAAGGAPFLFRKVVTWHRRSTERRRALGGSVSLGTSAEQAKRRV